VVSVRDGKRMKPQSLHIMTERLIIKYQLSIIRYFAIMVPPVVQGDRRFSAQYWVFFNILIFMHYMSM